MWQMPEASKQVQIHVCVFIHSELQLMYVYLHAYLFVCHLVFTHKYEDSILSDSLRVVLTETVECDGRQCSIHCYSSLQ